MNCPFICFEDLNIRRRRVSLTLEAAIGVLDNSSFTASGLTLFGERPESADDKSAKAEVADGDAGNAEAFFTGKPNVEELGYAFLFRNYRAENAKWQTADPIGYPDGWNQLAYVKNKVAMCSDLFGMLTVEVDGFLVTVTYTGQKWGAVKEITGTRLMYEGTFFQITPTYVWKCIKKDCEFYGNSGTYTGDKFYSAIDGAESASLQSTPSVTYSLSSPPIDWDKGHVKLPGVLPTALTGTPAIPIEKFHIHIIAE